MPLLPLSFSNQKWWNFLMKLKLKIVLSSANMSTTNYLPSLMAGLYFSPLLIALATKGHLKTATVTTTTYGKGAFLRMASKTWNKIQSQVKDPIINIFSLQINWTFFCLICIWNFIKLKDSLLLMAYKSRKYHFWLLF